MSFKVHNGLKVNTSNNVTELHDLVNQVRDTVVNYVNYTKAKDVKALACLLYDYYYCYNISLFQEKEGTNPLLVAMQRIRHSLTEKEEFEYFLGFANVDNKHTVAIPFFPNYECIETMLKNHPEFEPFGYWNDTDPDENVSKKEWEKRRKIWEKVFEHSGVPSETMFMIRLVDSRLIIPDDENMEKLPTIEERKKTLARDKAFQKALDKEQETNEDVRGEDAYQLYVNAMQNSKQYEEEIEKELEGLLDTNLTMEKLEKDIEMENNNES